jgi:hypothetical protein
MRMRQRMFTFVLQMVALRCYRRICVVVFDICTKLCACETGYSAILHNRRRLVRRLMCRRMTTFRETPYLMSSLIRWGTAGLLEKKNTYRKLYNSGIADISVFVIFCPLRKKMTH